MGQVLGTGLGVVYVARKESRDAVGDILASDDFDRSDGSMGTTPIGGYTWTGAGAVSGNACVITPEYGESLVEGDTDNGNMETGDPPTDWPAVNGAITSSVADERTGGSGSKSLHALRGTADVTANNNASLTSNTWYSLDGWIKAISETNASFYITGITGILSYRLQSAEPTWEHQCLAGISNVTGSAYIRPVVRGSGTQEARFDDIRLRPITTSTMFAGMELPYQNVDARIGITTPTNTSCPAGLFIAGDAANPTNGVIAFRTTSNIFVNQVIAGEHTNKINVAKTYSAGATLRLVKAGDTYSVYYGAAFVGSTEITGMEGKYCGIFSTDAGNVLDNWQVIRNG
jgi:hypothetical protein